MSASDRFARDGIDPDKPGREVDWDRGLEVALTLGGVGFYFAGSAYGSVLLGGWMGAFALGAWGVPPVVYALVKANQRRTARELRSEFRGRQEMTSPLGLD